MATATIDACLICANSFNLDFYKPVFLPCGHAFCQLCLVRLRASGRSKCPTCRFSWEGFNVPALPGIEALAGTLQVDQEDEDPCKKKALDDRCRKHSMPYDFWVSAGVEFYCRGCAAENPPAKLELIENSIPEIKAALARDVPNATTDVASHLQSLDAMHEKFVLQRNCADQFMKAVEIFNDNLKRNIDQIVTFKSEMMETILHLNKLERTIDSITSTADLHLAVECKSTLKKVAVRFSLPFPDLWQTLLCNIICTYVEEADTENAPFKASLVKAVLKGSPEPLLEMVRASEKLSHGQNWTVDNKNCDAVRLALSDKQIQQNVYLSQTRGESKQPKILTLTEIGDGCEALPVAALVKAVKNCVVKAKFVDTFYSAEDTTTDARRLKHLLANKSATLERFYGHLDHSAIAELPHTVTELGLAIGSADDAAAVSGLSPWKGLISIDVSVSSRVAVRNLKPMPLAPHKRLFFPFLTDANVGNVRPAIDALVPELRLKNLSFPKCLLTATGVRRLAHHLRGVKVDDNITIEATGSWRPGAQERTIMSEELRPGEAGVKKSPNEAGVVKWDMNWFYC